MKRISCIILFLCCVFSNALAEERIYNVAVDSPYPPFAYTDEKTGLLTGFDVDIAVALCKQLQIKCAIHVVPFDEIIPQIFEGKMDIGVAGMSPKEERKQFVLFTDKYFRSSSLFLEHPGTVTVSVEGLTGKKIAVQAQTSQESYLRSTYGHVATIVPYSLFDDVVKALLAKDVDVAFLDGLPAYHLLKSDMGLSLEMVGDSVTLGNASCIAVNKSLPELRDKLNEAIQAIRANGEYDRINRKYFEFNVY